MPGKAYIKQSGAWVRIPKIYIKSGGFWTSLQKAYIKISGAWVKVFDSTSSAPQLDTTLSGFRPQIRYLNFRTGSPNAGITPVDAGEPIIMGPGSQWGAGKPGTTNTGVEGGTIKYLYCFDGFWINDAGATEIRSIQANTTTDTNTWTGVGDGEESVVGGGIDLLANTFSKIRFWDNYYIWYSIRKTITGVGSTLELDGPLKLIRQAPTINTFTMTNAATPTQNIAQTVNFQLANQWYKIIDRTISYIEWFETTGANDALTTLNRVSGPTLLSSLTLTSDGTVGSSTFLSGSSSYTPTTTGKYLAAQITYKNSNSTYYGLTPTSIVRSTAVIGGPRPVGTASTVVATRTSSSYVHTVTNNGTWSGTPTSYRYQWYVLAVGGMAYTWNPISGATSATYDAAALAPTATTTYIIMPVVWATNANGESISGHGLSGSSGVIASTLGGISPAANIQVNYKEPIINTFTVTGGVNKFTYVSDYLVYDPTYTAVISWTGTGTGSLNVTSSAATQTSAFLAAGTYNFTLTVTNTGSSGGGYSKSITRSTITITAPTAYSFAFGNTMYVGTNGHIHFDAGYTASAPSTGKALAIYLSDLIQGQPTADTIGLKYWSDGSNYVIQFKGYGYANPASYTSAYALDYQVKFNTANAFADVSIIRKGGTVPQPAYVPGMYVDSQKWIPGVNGLPTYTVPTDITDEGDTANAYTYRLNFNGTQGSLSIIPWANRQATPTDKRYRIPDSIMKSAQAINSTNNAALITAGSLDDGWTKLTALANQYTPSILTTSTATVTSSSISMPFITGGADYSTYSYVLRTGSHTGTVVASSTGQTSNPLVINTGLTASTQYYLTMTPANSMAQNGANDLSTATTTAAGSPPVNLTVPTLSGGLNVGTVFTFTPGTWTGSPTSYALYLYRGTQFVATSQTLVAGPLNLGSSTYTIQPTDFTGTPTRHYFRAFATATNAFGTSSSGALTAGQELGPITNTVAALKPPNAPTGLTTPSSGTSPTLVFNASSWIAPAVDATHNAATYYQVYFQASTAQAGTYVAATNTFNYNYYQGSPLTAATNANTAATAVGVYNTSVSAGRITAAAGSYTWVKMWVRAANADGFSAWVSQTG
jgi:hypothetical protein